MFLSDCTKKLSHPHQRQRRSDMRIRELIALSVILLAGTLHAQEIELPTDPLNGRIVFEEKKCIACHMIGGYGGRAGPDLSRDQYFGSALELASVIWNHAPQMNRKFRLLRMDRPQLTEGEMLDLLGFLYYLRYLGEPGSVANGRNVLNSKGCIACHAVGGQGGTTGPDFKTIQRYSAPLYLVQAMWNHGPTMQEQITKGKMKYPMLSGRDVVDIAAYLRQASTADVEVRLSVGNPKRGREPFEEKRCSTCHVGEEEGARTEKKEREEKTNGKKKTPPPPWRGGGGRGKQIEAGIVKIDLKKGV